MLFVPRILFCADLQLKAEILSHIGSIADGENIRGSADKYVVDCMFIVYYIMSVSK